MPIDESKKRVAFLTYEQLTYLHDLIELHTERVGKPVTLSEHWMPALESSKNTLAEAIEKVKREEGD